MGEGICWVAPFDNDLHVWQKAIASIVGCVSQILDACSGKGLLWYDYHTPSKPV